MPTRRLRFLGLVLGWICAAPWAHAFLTFDDGKDKVFVSSTYAFGYDTNVFARAAKQGSITQNWSFEADYTRRAGIISVAASANVNFGAFAGLPGQDYADPGFTLDLTKGTGRTTGSVDLTLNKVNAPDPVANNRAIAWQYSGALALRYPINERFFLSNSLVSGGSAYANRILFTDLSTYSDAFNVNIVYDSKLDFSGGYTVDLDQTHDVTVLDHSVVLGANGALWSKITGSLVLGYTLNDTYYSHPHFPTGTFDAYDVQAKLDWRFAPWLSFSGSAARNLGISSTDVADDSITLGLFADMSIGKKLRLHTGVNYIPTRYLGRNSQGRRDYLFEYQASLQTALTTHINIGVSYLFSENYSNLSFSRFIRETVSADINAKY
ncbi:MAG TPA: hypothetical protein VHC86_02030 [Opitutaceae bacterium]|nr:hypothetical protein [Opitutaceae bacterium]